MKSAEEQNEWVQQILGIMEKRRADPDSITLVDWDGRPGVIRQATDEAYAIVRENGDWVPGNYSDMLHTGKLISSHLFYELWPYANLSLVPWKQTGRA